MADFLYTSVWAKFTWNFSEFLVFSILTFSLTGNIFLFSGCFVAFRANLRLFSWRLSLRDFKFVIIRASS